MAIVVLAATFAGSASAAKEVVAGFGTSGSLGGRFGDIADISVNSSGAGPANPGDTYVLEETQRRIQRVAQNDNGTPANPYDDSYEFVSAWGSGVKTGETAYEICDVAAECKAGTNTGTGGDGGLLRPEGIAVDEDTGDVFVVDTETFRVNVYAGDGTFLRSFGFDVVASGPGNTGVDYEVCVPADGDVCKVGLPGAGLGQLDNGRAIAVSQPDGNPATGTVFVADAGNTRVNTYDLDGTDPSSFGSSAQFGSSPRSALAIDSRGILYIADGNNGQEIDRYDTQDANGGGIGFLASIPAPPVLPSNNNGTVGLEVDPDSDGAGPDEDELFVLRVVSSAGNVNSVIQQFGPTNDPGLATPPVAADDTHGSLIDFGFAIALGLDTASGQLFVAPGGNPANGNNSSIYVLDSAGASPTAAIDSISSVSATSATVNGVIDPNGPPTVSYHVEYSLDGSNWSSTEEVQLGIQETPQNVSVSIDPSAGLTPNSLYHVRLAANKLFAPPVVSTEETFTTPSSAPLVETTGTPLRTTTTAQLLGRVDPRLAPTKFHFEYLSDAEFQSGGFAGAKTTPDEGIGVNEVQSIAVQATSGQFVLSFEGQSTGDLPFDAPAAVVQSALRALPAIGAGNVIVSGGPGSGDGSHPYLVTFTGALAATDVPPIEAADGSTSLGDEAGGSVETTTQGGGGDNEVQEITIKAAAGEYTLVFGSESGFAPLQYDYPPFFPEFLLGLIPSIGSGNVHVSGGPGSPSGSSPYIVEFTGALANKNVGELSVGEGPTPLSIGSEAMVSTVTPGGPADEFRLASASVDDLEPSTTYRYRIVADNGNPGSPVFGDGVAVTTRASEDPLSHGHFPGPAGSDRAWEQINTPETGGNPVIGGYGFSTDGNRALYQIAGGTPISDGGSLFGIYFAQRIANGWQSQSVTPPRDQLVGPNWYSPAASDDLSAIFARNFVSSAGRPSRLFHLEPSGPPAVLHEAPAGDFDIFAASNDGSRLVATLAGAPDPDYPAVTERQLYDVTSGVPQLIGLMPGGGVPSCQISIVGSSAPAAAGSAGVPLRASKWVSPDGSQVLFLCGRDLYLRDLGAAQTALVSQGDCAATLLKSTPGAVFYWCGNASGQDGDVYRYDLGDESRDCVTCVVPGVDADIFIGSGSGAGPDQIAVAADGSRVYFRSPNRLLPGTVPNGIYRVEVASGDLAYVASIGASTVGEYVNASQAVTPDGSVLIFGSSNPALNPLGGSFDNGGTYQYYRYDDNDRSLVCLSCPQDSSAPKDGVSHSLLGITSIAQTAPGDTTLSDDGATFAFTTTTPLVGLDQNSPKTDQSPDAGTDVYEWRDGRLLLVSDGLSNWPANSTPLLSGISPSGRDIYFTAAAQYTPDALDSYYRLYDARIGGGIEFPKAPPPCPLEVCQGTPKGAPEEAPPGTGSFAGAGNPVGAPAARSCPKGKRKVRQAGKSRCVARKSHHRKAHNNRRAAR